MTISNVEHYTFSSTDALFFDTNIWLSIYGPVPYLRKRSQKYSSCMRDVLVAGAKINIDSMIISEFINRFSKIEFDRFSGKFSGKYNSYKAFRNSKDFKPTAEEISIAVGKILKNCTKCEIEFSVIDMGDLMNEFANGGVDFNDQMLAELCAKQGFTLVTDDGDFKCSQIEILTANPRLLIKK